MSGRIVGSGGPLRVGSEVFVNARTALAALAVDVREEDRRALIAALLQDGVDGAEIAEELRAQAQALQARAAELDEHIQALAAAGHIGARK